MSGGFSPGKQPLRYLKVQKDEGGMVCREDQFVLLDDGKHLSWALHEEGEKG